MTQSRSSGILLHLTSLPGPYGIGDLGPEAYRFIDFLARTGQRYWQMLPLVPIGHGNSPYAGLSTFAGNRLLISPDLLREQGLLADEDLASVPSFPAHRVAFDEVIRFKDGLLNKAFERFEAGLSTVDHPRYVAFCERNAAWLDDFALFMTLKQARGDAAWTDWEPPLARRHPEAMAEARKRYDRQVRQRKLWQFLFDEQWRALKAYANERGVLFFGDLPIYVAHDSADVWAQPHLFLLDEYGHPTVVAGVPPDYFSETGQRWGNPIYRWDVMQENGYAWWTRRFAKIMEWVDLVRLDHFRGFEAYWEVPANEDTAIHGRWVKGPGASLFHTLRDRLGTLPVVAENLGFITPEVVSLMETFGFPGMAILQFAFDGDADAEFLPHNYSRNLIAYTGTHDNDTVVGWWTDTQSTQDAEQIAYAHAFCRHYLGLADDGGTPLHWAFIRSLFASVAMLAVVPLQDLLGLGSEARMNTPGLGDGNWGWRFTADQLTPQTAERLKRYTEVYGRSTNRRPTFPDVP